MTINLFANVLNDDAIDNLTDEQADAVLAMFDKARDSVPVVEPIDRATIDRAKAATLEILNSHKEA